MCQLFKVFTNSIIKYLSSDIYKFMFRLSLRSEKQYFIENFFVFKYLTQYVPEFILISHMLSFFNESHLKELMSIVDFLFKYQN